jgi:hypothetical protein
MAPRKSNVKYHIQLMRIITRSKPGDRATILKHLNDKGVHFICEVIHNIINGNLHLSKKQRGLIRRGLMSEKECYRYLSKKKNNLYKKRKLIEQHGEGIGLLLARALPYAVQLIESLFKKK